MTTTKIHHILSLVIPNYIDKERITMVNKKNFALTRMSCYVGIFVQAIVCNITPILFIPMMGLYDLNYVDLGVLVAINFIAQVLVDIIFSGVIDKWGYKKIALPAIFCGFVGLVMFALSPVLFKDNVFLGIAISTVIFASASGLLEVMVSPIVNSLPSEDKGASMSLMHSFYAWGQMATIILTTLFIFVFKAASWQIIVLIWAIVPLVNFVMFARSPFPESVPLHEREPVKHTIFKPFFIIAMLAILFGAATEITMAQWASTFMEKALSIPKVTGDLLGMCGFALMMGIGRLTYGINGAKMNMHNVLIFGSALGFVCYLTVAFSSSNVVNVIACAVTGLAASLLWPGTLVVAAEKFPLAGAWLFAILAAAGDIGGAVGPYLTGLVVDNSMVGNTVNWIATTLNTTNEQAAIRIGIAIASLFPLIAFVCHVILKRMRREKAEKDS